MELTEILAITRDLVVTVGVPSLIIAFDRFRRREIEAMAAQIKLLERISAPEMAKAIDAYKQLLDERSEQLGGRILELEHAHSVRTDEVLLLQAQLQSIETDRNVLGLVEKQLRSEKEDALKRVRDLVDVARTQTRRYVMDVLIPECKNSATREFEYFDEPQQEIEARAREKIASVIRGNGLECEWQCWSR